MTRIGFKTFIYSFVFTLSAIISVDRAFFYTPRITEDNVQIPRKNIALFFRPAQPYTYSSQTEPVEQIVLQEPEGKAKKEPEKLEVAENVPVVPQQNSLEESIVEEEKEIPLIIEKIPEADKMAELNNIPDMPLVYSGDFDTESEIKKEEKEDVLLSEKPIETPEKIETAEEIMDNKPIVLSEQSGPITIKATKQVFKIDNVKKYKERKAAESQKTEKNLVKETFLEQKDIPLQGDIQSVKRSEEPEENQVASLGESLSLVEAEEEVKADSSQKERKWQTMAEKHKNDNPWLVARGSKFVKNKKILEEGFASEAAKKKADQILVNNKAEAKRQNKTTKIAVQDNLLIPIPQDLLDEDDLVPDISDDDKNATPTPKKKVKAKTAEKPKEKSILDSISSVFSKENREKAIKKLKAKGNNLLKTQKQEAEEERQVILPTEIRLSFQPNRAEISGQTLRWIQAFARKAVDEKDVGLEIRIDGSKSFALQQKRLNMLYNILTANGVEYQKINTAFVDREPNSFVVRTVKIVNAPQEPKEDDGWKKYYQKW